MEHGGNSMSKNANKRARRNALRMSDVEIARFKTGYEDDALVAAAYAHGELKGTAQKKKKDRMAYGVRYNNKGHIKTGKASKQSGVFLGADSQEDDSYAREMGRIQIAVGENARTVEAFRN